jgi:hypothetical protein
MTLTPNDFYELCKGTYGAEENLKTALDLIAIHREKDVKGPQPRKSLNPFIALAAAAAWERFLADVVGAAQGTATRPWPGPGHSELGFLQVNQQQIAPQWAPSHLNTYLRNKGVINGNPNLTDSWEAWLDNGPSGPVMLPSKWKYLKYLQNPSSFDDALKNAQHLRNGAAHFALPRSALKSIPYGYTWQGDAVKDSVQHWAALPVAALFFQLIKCSIVAIATDHGWNPDKYQLPHEWLEDTPCDGRYQDVSLWKRSLLAP